MMRNDGAPGADESEALLGALLGGDAVDPVAVTSWDADRLFRTAHQHRVHLLLAERFKNGNGLERYPASLRDALAMMIRQQALFERARALELGNVLASLAGEGVHPVLLKGVALAYRCYPRPYLRPRIDTDLFIPREAVGVVRGVMDRAGYSRSNTLDGEMITHQFQYVKQGPVGLVHEYDFHWRLSNTELFANLLSFENIERDAVNLAALGPHASAPSDVHSLFVACIHRVAHHNDADDLIWLYDIHLLANRMTNDEWRAFEALAVRSRTREVCGQGLNRARQTFGTDVPPNVMAALLCARGEASAAFLGGRLRRIDVEFSNFHTLTNWRARAQFLRQHLFPSAGYMLRSYNVTSPIWLPALYMHRIVLGSVRWLRPLRCF